MTDEHTDTEIGEQDSPGLKEYREVNGTRVFQRENSHGLMKDWVEVELGSSVVECRRRKKNPVTGRTHDMTKLADDGYLKKYLALDFVANTQDHINLRTTPVLTFDKERWEVREMDGTVVVEKREPESRLGDAIL